MYYCCGISETGNTRKHNEDAFLINKIVMSHAKMESFAKEPFITAVADGVSGERSGEIASKLSLRLLADVNFSKSADIKKELNNIHKSLMEYGMSHSEALNMQTTLCALAVDEENLAYSINIGDSRMYRFFDGKLVQLTKDQSLVQLLCDAGAITEEEKFFHEKKNYIFPVLGDIMSPPCTDIIKIGKINPGELILICTDGLSDYVRPEEISIVLSRKERLLNKLSELVKLALKRGSLDNITIVAVSAGEE